VRQRLQVRMATGTMTTTVTATNTTTTVACAPIQTTSTTTFVCGPPLTTTLGCGPGHGVGNSGNCSITVQEAAYGTFSITVWSTELATLKLISEDDYAHCQQNTYETRAATFTWTPPRHVEHDYEATFYALCQPVDLAMGNASAEVNFQVRQRVQVRMATGTMTTTATGTNTTTTVACAPIPTTHTTTWACGPPLTTTIGCGPGQGVGKDVTITVSGGKVQDAVVKQETSPALGFPFTARFAGVGVASLVTVALLVALLSTRGSAANNLNEETMEALVE
jgi:hypothetical protein